MTHQAGPGPLGTRVTVFCGRSENIGQTTTVIGTARQMAASGLRVLVVTVRNADTWAESYLRNGLGGVPSDGSPPEPAPDTLPPPERWRLPVGDTTVPLWFLTLRDSAATALLPARGEAAGAALYAGFDRVLVDAPVPRTEAQIGALVPLAHTLAACFAPTSWSVDGTAALLGEMERLAGGLPDVVAVGIQTDSRLSEQLRLARDQVRAAFRELGGAGETPYVEIPFDPGQDTARRPSAPPPATEARHGLARLAEVLDHPRPGGVGQVVVVYPQRSRAWAEWIGAQLTAAGVTSAEVPLTEFAGEGPPRGGMLLVVSPTGATPEQTALLARLSHPEMRIVLVDAEPLTHRLGHHEQIDLRTGDEAEAAALLGRVLRLASPAGASAVPFPRLPARHNLPPRDPDFTGHDRLCLELRRGFSAGDPRAWTCLVTGPPGSGKSALAREFCHRFGGAYDIVWRLRASDRAGIERGLGMLAGAAGMPGPPAGPRDVLRRLESPDAGSWLLVYDDADDLAALEDLLPATGPDHHVLLTSRGPAGPGRANVGVPPLTAEESRQLLATAVPGLGEDQADQVGQVVGRTPLNLILAGAWIEVEAEHGEADNRPRADALREASRRLLGEFSGVQEDLLVRHGQAPLHRVMLEVALDGLARSAGGELWAREANGSAGLVWLLECCALLTPTGAELDLLRSPALWGRLAALPGRAPEDTPPGDAHMIDVALWALARQGLLDVRFDHPEHPGRPGSPERRVRQIRRLRELVLERMAPGAREEREREVRAAVADVGAADTALGGRARIDARTRRLTSLSLWADERPGVRRALLDHLAELVDTNERRHLLEALEIARHAADAWKSAPPCMEYLRLHNLSAKANRVLGRFPDATRDALVALRGHRTALGVNHPRALLSADSYGAILRAEGAPAEARIEGHGVVRSLRGVLGPDHPATAQAEHNLALSEGLCGNHRAALELLRGRWARRQALRGPEAVPALLDAMALMHRGLGQNRESFNLLKEVMRHTRGRTSADSLNAEIGLAVSERRLGRPEWALERDRRVLEECRTRFGDGQLRTERCRFSLAADLHAVGGAAEAVAAIRACLGHLEATLGPDHPYSHLCRIRLGVHLRAVDREEALKTGREAMDGMTSRIGPEHPWVVAAGVSLAYTLVGCGQYDEAYDKERAALEVLDDLGLTAHPDHALVARNHAATGALRNPAAGPPVTGHRDIDLELPGL